MIRLPSSIFSVKCICGPTAATLRCRNSGAAHGAPTLRLAFEAQQLHGVRVGAVLGDHIRLRAQNALFSPKSSDLRSSRPTHPRVLPPVPLKTRSAGQPHSPGTSGPSACPWGAGGGDVLRPAPNGCLPTARLTMCPPAPALRRPRWPIMLYVLDDDCAAVRQSEFNMAAHGFLLSSSFFEILILNRV